MVFGDLPMLINYRNTNMALLLYQRLFVLFVDMGFFIGCDVHSTHSQNVTWIRKVFMLTTFLRGAPFASMDSL